jgi:uncharacterized protein (DUF1786 family)
VPEVIEVAATHVERVEAIPVIRLLDDPGAKVSGDCLQVCIEPCGCLLERIARSMALPQALPEG